MSHIKTFSDPNNFRKSLEMRLLNLAHSSGQDLQRLRKQVAFERFLARLFSESTSPWILKGGHAMELRMESARVTQDIDLSLKGNRVSIKSQLILESLQLAMSATHSLDLEINSMIFSNSLRLSLVEDSMISQSRDRGMDDAAIH